MRTPSQSNPSYEYITRGDFNATANDVITARFIGTQQTFTPDLFANPNALPTQETQQGGPARNFGAFWTHVFSPTKVNEFRFTAQQINFTFGPTASTAGNPLFQLPNVTVAGFSSGQSFLGLAADFPQGRGHDTYEYQEAFSWTSGNHSIKVGADLTHLAINDQIPFNNRGTVAFVGGGDCGSIGLATCTGLANFLDNFTGPSGTAGRQIGSPNVSYAQTIQAFYFLDNWKLRPSVTVQYGLRYEIFGTPFQSLPFPAVNPGTALTTPENIRITQIPDRNNFGPRVSLAWNPAAGKTVYRAGFGVFYDVIFANIVDNVASSAPNTLGGTITAPTTGRGTANALGLVPSVTATLNPLAATSVVPANLVAPMTYQWNVNVERQVPAGFLARVAYVGTRGERLFLNQELNPGVNGVRLNPNRGSIGARMNSGDSIYHSLQADLTRRFRNGFMADLAYTWSKAIDNGSEVFVNSGGSSYPQDPFNLRGERGPSAFDRTHRVALTWLYSLPYRGGSGGALGIVNYLVRNWTISGTMQLQSGAPDTIYLGGFDENDDLRATNDRPDLGNPQAPINYSSSCLNSTTCITGVGEVGANGAITDFNTGAPGTASQFRYLVVSGRPGNLGRNTYRNDWRQDWTLAAERIIPIPHLEGHQIELRAEGINPWNHPNPGLVSTDVLDPTFLNRSLVYTGGRTVNLWLKYRF